MQEAVLAHWRTIAPPDAVAAHLWVALKHEITYRKPAFLDDEVIAKVLLERIQGARAFYETIIKRGEEVLTARDPRHVRNGGGRSTPVNVTIVANDPNSFRNNQQEIAAGIGSALARAVLASCTIPFALEAVQDVPGGPPGWRRHACAEPSCWRFWPSARRPRASASVHPVASTQAWLMSLMPRSGPMASSSSRLLRNRPSIRLARSLVGSNWPESAMSLSSLAEP